MEFTDAEKVDLQRIATEDFPRVKQLADHRVSALARQSLVEIKASDKRLAIDPILAWGLGIQMVSMEEKDDTMRLLNHCKFLENGGKSSGYVLKPEYMRSSTAEGDVKNPLEFRKIRKKVTIKVLCGW